MRNTLKISALITISLITLGSCVSVPGTGKKAFITTSVAQENKLGVQAYSEILKKEKISNNKRWNAILQRVGARIAKQAPVDFNWKFTLIEDKQKNAFCLPGGKVAFYTGIFPVAQTEAAIAVVMGHEVAHAVARHAGQRITQAQYTQMGLVLADGLLLSKSENRKTYLGLLGVGLNVGVALPFSRSHEKEADVLGLSYAAKAGYDPRAAAPFWARMGAGSKGAPPEFLSTHPAPASRVKNLQKLATQLMDVYQNSPKYGMGETL